MGDIKFEFNLGKLIHAIAFFYGKGIDDLTKLKVSKLLYFADKKHLLEHGTPILGDVYWCMDFGPVPSFALNEMSEAISRSEMANEAGSDYTCIHRVLKVKRSFFSPYPKFEAKQAYDSSVFVQSEIEVLTFVAKQYGNNTARQLVDLIHREPTWIIANAGRCPGGRTPIAYELFFEGAPTASMRHLGKLKADFSGEAIPLSGDTGYSEFAASLRSYQLEPEFELDCDFERAKSRPVAARAQS